MDDITDVNSLDAMLASKDTTPAPAAEPTPAPAPTPEPAPVAEPAPVETPEVPAAPEATPPEPMDPESVFTNKSKQNAAFAQQRVENKQLKDTVSRLAKTLGIEEASDINKTVQALNERLLAYEAEKSNVPLPVLQAQEKVLQEKQELEQQLYKQQAITGFAQVQSMYKLKPEQVKEFAEQVLDSGMNPFAEPVDLIREYRMLNFDKIMKQTADDATQAAVEKQKKALNQSSTPAVSVGSPPAVASSVSTVADLNRMLDQMSK